MWRYILPVERFPRSDVERYMSSLLLIVFGVACAAATAVFGFSELFLGSGALAPIYLAAPTGCLLIVFAFRRSGNLKLWGNGFIGLLFAVAAIANLGSGGLAQGVNMVLPTLMVLAALMLDKPSALVWAVLIMLQMGFAIGLANSDIVPWIKTNSAWTGTAYQRVPVVMTVLAAVLAIWFKSAMHRIQQHLNQAIERERQALKEAEFLTATLSTLARSDALTGLLNRRALQEQFAELDDQQEYWLLAIDLDGFKAINDSLGHDVGDRVLTDVAAILKRHANLAAARMGGDEFCLLVQGGEFVARQCAERVIDDVRALVTGGPTSPRIGASIGLARLDTKAPEATLRAADQASYLAKRSGKGRYEMAERR